MDESNGGQWLGITPVDWLVIVGYLVGITIIGTWAIRKVKSAASFFISDRKFGKVLMMFFNFGTGTHSDQAVSVAAKTYRVGASGIWYQLLWVFSTPFYWVIAPMFRRMRAITTSDYFEARYNTGVGMLYAVVAIMNLIVNIGVMLKGSSAMIEAISGGSINSFYATMAMTAMFLIYGVAGGLSAAIITDLIQGILTIVLSFLILPFAFAEISRLTGMGPMEGMRTTIGNPEMFGLVSSEITLFYIIVISLNGLIGYGCQPHTMSLCAAGKTEMEARVGMTCGMFIKRFCTVAWVLTGLCAVAYYMLLNQEVTDVDHVYGRMARDLLPKIGYGLVGLFIASMLAALMSSCDAFMVAGSALFTGNVYRRVIVRNAGDRHYMMVGRLVAVLIVGAGILFAFSLESVVTGLEVFWKISAMMGLAFWAGLFWRRTTVAAVWIGTLVTFAAFLFTGQLRVLDKVLWDFNTQYAESLPKFLQKDPGLVPEIPESLAERLGELPEVPERLRDQIAGRPRFTYALKAELKGHVEGELENVTDTRNETERELEDLQNVETALVALDQIGPAWRALASADLFEGHRQTLLAEVQTAKSAAEDRLAEIEADLKLLEEFHKLRLPELALPWQMVIYLTIGLVTIVVVSLLTQPVAEENLDRFYACLRTPVGPDEPETEPFTLPPGVKPAPRRLLINLPGFEIPMPSLIGVMGVVITGVAVALFIVGVYWIFGLGA
ncbi:MAG: sodium:solute symporter family protein [Planctomycetota bacterium]|jgi:Na+/proline symporter